jgi:hypothetical protein
VLTQAEEAFVSIAENIFKAVTSIVPKENHFVIAIGANVDGNFRSRMYHPKVTDYNRALLLLADAMLGLKYHFGDMVTPETKNMERAAIERMHAKVEEHMIPNLFLFIKIITDNKQTVVIQNIPENARGSFLKSFSKESATSEKAIAKDVS